MVPQHHLDGRSAGRRDLILHRVISLWRWLRRARWLGSVGRSWQGLSFAAIRLLSRIVAWATMQGQALPGATLCSQRKSSARAQVVPWCVYTAIQGLCAGLPLAKMSETRRVSSKARQQDAQLSAAPEPVWASLPAPPAAACLLAQESIKKRGCQTSQAATHQRHPGRSCNPAGSTDSSRPGPADHSPQCPRRGSSRYNTLHNLR